MSEQYMSELRLFPYGFAPKGWAYCEGQSLPIPKWNALFSLLGTAYGGDGIRTFNLPDLRGRAALGAGTDQAGTTYPRGQSAGEARHTLTSQETPPHAHTLTATTDTTQAGVSASGTLLAGAVPTAYAPPGAGEVVQLDPAAIAPTGGQAHENMQPYLGLTWCIALVGIYPSRN
ncbi:MAG: tail fiber protein [Patulibacter minatonensis]